MPSIAENKDVWNQHDWSQQGGEWSSQWGSASAQWEGSLLPRVERFFPTGTILEIAPGGGRWTEFLRKHCERLIGVDLSPVCVETCRKRFAGDPNCEFHVNDGRSLAMIEDGSIDFAFSFDSLVHVEGPDIGAYVEQLARKLKPDGGGFIHHSNLAACRHSMLFEKLPQRVKDLLIRKGLAGSDHWRARSMSAALFDQQCTRAGMQCVSQELINWGGNRLLDCLSVFVNRASKFTRANRIVENRDFMREAEMLARRVNLYSQPSADASTGVTSRT